ncbi:helix-turn-helix domain-containing protein [Kitasatospora sp. NPDC049285]|uniref:helix-turn-helix domain-containing protein n=1 Tax=Kitasatospora sp. NPDC049285 TaxID=3157096 RepID=UPI00342DD50C
MSIQLLLVAGYLEEEVVGGKTNKLVLMKLADSADDQTRISHPGLTRLMAWAMVSDKTVVSTITDLIGRGLVERVKVGRAGQRAEYRVFPLGVPPIPTTEELEALRAAKARAPKNGRLARVPASRGRPDVPARTHADVQARVERLAAQAPKTRREPSGSPAGNPDAGSPWGRSEGGAGLPKGNPAQAGSPNGNPEVRASRVSDPEPPGSPDGNPGGSGSGTPVLPVPSSSLPFPPTPTADAAGEPAAHPGEGQASGCPKHASPAANCRGCGTNARAQRDAQRKELAEADRRNREDWVRAFVQDQEERAQLRAADPDRVATAFSTAREIAARAAQERRERGRP